MGICEQELAMMCFVELCQVLVRIFVEVFWSVPSRESELKKLRHAAQLTDAHKRHGCSMHMLTPPGLFKPPPGGR